MESQALLMQLVFTTGIVQNQAISFISFRSTAQTGSYVKLACVRDDESKRKVKLFTEGRHVNMFANSNGAKG